ncbi:ATP-binding protein [Terasakiella sp. A23]|uniref:sensor histidine kinase n=1 Tax=Terasakiella sp. FCG-A23 TaxID=3080561 RepID=UPI002955D17C|nr:ATP-binding protein [Terasakiella sp. A23]MDV7338298.1 ATP-binding protein [Terasakiella sp. A23]
MGQSQPPHNPLEFNDGQENAWVEVIQKMDEVYSDLLEREVDLENKNAELEEAHDFIDSIMEAMSDVLIVCDRVGRIVKVNRPLLDLTGFEEEVLFGKPISILLGKEFEEKFRTLIPPTSHKGLHDYEAQLRHKDGKAVDPVSLNCTLHKTAKGVVDGLVIVGRPIGELRQAYDQLNQAHSELKTTQSHLLQSEKMASIGRLVAGVAHELNNPISFLYGNVHSMQRYATTMRIYIETLRDELPVERRHELDESLRIERLLNDLPSLLEGTQEGAERVSDIVNNLRRLSFREGKSKDKVDLSDVIKTAILFAAKGRSSDQPIDLEVADDCYVEGSANRLHQVILNLVENALDATSETDSKNLKVSCFQAGDTVEIHVQDFGPGLKEDDIHKIFDPFFTTKPVGEGTGLGLWISYEIVQDHNGQISVRNHPEGGAEFKVVLPAWRK